MSKDFRTTALAALISTTPIIPVTSAQAYPIDCAILICLSGGWAYPSAECTVAQIEFLRRVTPWPIEPPVQIWNCPLGVAFKTDEQHPLQPLYDLTFPEGLRQSTPDEWADLTPVEYDAETLSYGTNDLLSLISNNEGEISNENGTADVDISGKTFDFLRSIRVFTIEIRDESEAGSCSRRAKVKLGSYGEQGDFSWDSSNRTEIPEAFGTSYNSFNCNLQARSVFIDWTDYSGNYGSDRIDY